MLGLLLLCKEEQIGDGKLIDNGTEKRHEECDCPADEVRPSLKVHL